MVSSSTKKRKVALRRYTSVPSILQILKNRQITLLSPDLWDDRNDAYYMSQFKEEKNFKTVLALCFAETVETYHHWRVFTHGSDGACITFRKQQLLKSLAHEPMLKGSAVRYEWIKKITKNPPTVDELPFLKRRPYRDEREYRLIYTDKNEKNSFKGFDIELDTIERVTLSPWMPKALVEVMKQIIHDIEGCQNLKVTHSTLLQNETWKQAATRLRRK